MGKAQVSRSVYWPHQRYDDATYGAAVLQVWGWGGSSVHRTERLSYEISSDYCRTLAVRHSDDNGASFGQFALQARDNPRQGGLEREDFWFALCHDPLRAHDVRFDFQRVFVGTGPAALAAHWRGDEKYFDHGFYCLSRDRGCTFSRPRLLRFEEGADYDEADWGQERYLRRNTMYGGYTATMTRAGRLVYPFTTRTSVAASAGPQTTDGVRCMIGTWDDRAGDYRWETSQTVAVPLSWSGRGLLEPAVAELEDGRLALAMRGSTDMSRLLCPTQDVQVTEPGRHWLAVSEDGGYHWTAAREWRYADGGQFYAPSSLARLLRHSRGKLYWIGNIVPEPPSGNMPRHPLVIAEVDETGPALVRESVTVIDTKDEQEQVAPEFQLSNFQVLENAKTGVIELYLTRYGESPEHWLKADVYKYLIEVP